MVTENFTNLAQRSWSREDLKSISEFLIINDQAGVLLDGFEIFCPTCSLVPFLRFCKAFDKSEDIYTCTQHLDDFKRGVSQMHMSSSTTSFQSRDGIFPVEWIEHLVLTSLSHIMKNLTSKYRMNKFLKILDQTNITRLFATKVPDYSKLCKMHQVGKLADVSFNYMALVEDDDSDIYREECEKILVAMIEKKMYNEARVFAEISGVPSHRITLQQIKTELNEIRASKVWDVLDGRISFWTQCSGIFKNHKSQITDVSQFFQEQAKESDLAGEKCFLLQTAFDWLASEESSSFVEQCSQLYLEIWKTKIQEYLEEQKRGSVSPDIGHMFDFSRQEGEKDSNKKPSFAKSELNQFGHLPREDDKKKVRLSEEESAALDSIVGQLLDKGHVKEVCRILANFGHYNQDLAIIVTILRLSQGHIATHKIEPNLKKLMASPSKRRLSRRRSTSFVSLPRIGSAVSIASQVTAAETELEEDEVLLAMQMLASFCQHGKHCCDHIINLCKIAKTIGISYDDLLNEDDFHVLKVILASSAANRYVLAKAFITTSNLTDAQVAGFLMDGIIESLRTWARLPDFVVVPDKVLLLKFDQTPRHAVSGISELIQLCDDPAILGQRLLDAQASMASSNVESSAKILSVQVELLVYAHDCFTLACNMECISAALRQARTITRSLEEAKEYQLMIRLLTGMGRFSEMTYIFEILKQQDQFELLLKKGIDKEETLRLAIMDYLKREHKEDSDAFEIVSHYFTMHREIAQMLETSARNMLKNISVGKTQDIETALQEVFRRYTEAAENYIKEDCLRLGQACVTKAKLVALQMQLLVTGQIVINLEKDKAKAFIAEHPKFFEALIVSEAYHNLNAWPMALCRQVLVNGDFKYLQDFENYLDLTPSLVNETINKYKSESPKPKGGTSNLKRFLGHISDIKLCYRIATEMGLTDYVQDLLKRDGGAYLQDTLMLKM